MSYDNERKKYNKIPLQFIEIDVNGVTTRFYDYDYGTVLIGFEGYPTLKSFSMSPAKIDLNGGIGIRATASAAIGDHQDYTVYGSLTSPVRYWAAWTAKNKAYRYQRVSHFSGYVVNGTYDVDNFIQRDYIIETMAWGGDGVKFSLRDPLMLANDDKAKLPLESNGSVSNNPLLVGDTSLTLVPLGIGDLEYPASNFYIIINEEVILCTSRTADVLTIVRGQYGTVAEEQTQDAKVQLCLWFDNDTISNMGYHLLTVGANVDTSYINKPIWDAASANAFPNVYTMLVTKPTGVRKLLKELCDSAPHYYYYDTRSNQIQFKAQESPQNTGQVLSYESNLLMGKTVISDRKDLQITTVVIYFDIRNPVKDLTEASNFRQVYVREDSASVTANGGTRVYKTVYSRVIGAGNKSAAILAASLTGRRFAIAPIQISYDLDPKDGEVWTGDAVRIESDLILNETSLLPDLRNYQIISANEDTNSQRFKYTALEHTYGPAVDGDEDVENPNTRLVFISGENDQLRDPETGLTQTLREYYEGSWGTTVLADYDVRFIVEVGAVAGSSDKDEYSIRTGEWPELITPILIINNNLIVGKGGDAGIVSGGNGGPAMILEDNIRLNNLGTIGGGGGAGGNDFESGSTAKGGGGAGYANGLGGVGSVGSVIDEASNSTNTAGGRGASVAHPTEGQLNGGTGGTLGASGFNGSTAGGSAGAAINLNGFVITYVNAGIILGTVS